MLASFLFLPFLGAVHLFDWDEINFAEISREMLVTGDFSRPQIDFFPFWEKPPLFFWLQAASMKMLGINEYAARFPNAICGIITVIFLYNVGSKIYTHRFGLLWSLAYMCSVLPFIYFKSAIIDPVFNFFIFLGIYFMILSSLKIEGDEKIVPNKGYMYIITGGIFIGLATLTKGPVAILITALIMLSYWVYRRFKFFLNVRQALLFVLFVGLTTLTWFGWETLKNGIWFISEFTMYQYRLLSTPDAGHEGFPGYHLVILLFGCFPASVFAVRSFWKMQGEETRFQKDFRIWMKLLFWVVLILFSIVESKIMHYTSLCYFPLTFLAAVVIDKILRKEILFRKWIWILLLLIGVVYSAGVILAAIIAKDFHILKPWLENANEFTQAALKADVNWSGWESVPGVVLILALLSFLWIYYKGKTTLSFHMLFLGCALFIFSSLVFFKRIEGYTQRAAIEFIKEKSNEDCYIINAGYKSYAPLYYGRINKIEEKEFKNREKKHNWLLWGKADKEVYIISRVDKDDKVNEWTRTEKIGEKNGYVFLKRVR